MSIRVDALGEKNDGPSVGIEHRAAVEARLRQLEGKTVEKLSGTAKGKPKDKKYDTPSKAATGAYNDAADSTLKKKKRKAEEEAEEEEEEVKPKKAKKAKSPKVQFLH